MNDKNQKLPLGSIQQSFTATGLQPNTFTDQVLSSSKQHADTIQPPHHHPGESVLCFTETVSLVVDGICMPLDIHTVRNSLWHHTVKLS